MWQLALLAGGSALIQGYQQRAQAKLNNKVSAHNAFIGNMMREANNELSAAKTALAGYQQSRRNQEHLKGTGRSLDALTTNSGRLMDEYVSGSLESRIQASEIAGALTARAGAANVGGGSTAMLEQANRMRAARAQQQVDDRYSQTQGDLDDNYDHTLEAGVLGLETTLLQADLDNMPILAEKQHVPSWMNILGQAAFQAAGTYASMGGFQTAPNKAIPVVDKGTSVRLK